jgi:hypothetical protein
MYIQAIISKAKPKIKYKPIVFLWIISKKPLAIDAGID